jgi:hypothetical protein
MKPAPPVMKIVESASCIAGTLPAHAATLVIAQADSLDGAPPGSRNYAGAPD